MAYRAITRGHQSLAKTAGAALDALTSQLPAKEAGTLVIVQSQQPDEFFTAQQQERLRGLIARWRAVREAGCLLPPPSWLNWRLWWMRRFRPRADAPLP
jgi:hypothetical protein